MSWFALPGPNKKRKILDDKREHKDAKPTTNEYIFLLLPKPPFAALTLSISICGIQNSIQFLSETMSTDFEQKFFAHVDDNVDLYIGRLGEAVA